MSPCLFMRYHSYAIFSCHHRNHSGRHGICPFWSPAPRLAVGLSGRRAPLRPDLPPPLPLRPETDAIPVCRFAGGGRGLQSRLPAHRRQLPAQLPAPPSVQHQHLFYRYPRRKALPTAGQFSLCGVYPRRCGCAAFSYLDCPPGSQLYAHPQLYRPTPLC